MLQGIIYRGFQYFKEKMNINNPISIARSHTNTFHLL